MTNETTTESEQRKEIDLAAGRIAYREAGSGKPIVFVHGFLVDGRLWKGVVDNLSDRYRCFTPDWPLGSHRTAVDPDADLSPTGVAALIASFLEALELEDVTIVGNDSGGAISQILTARHPERIGRLVLTNCDSHDNFPPRAFKLLPRLAALPGGMALISAPFRVPKIARAAFRPFSREPIADELLDSWLEPSTSDAAIRHDTKKFIVGMNPRYTLDAAERLRSSEIPLLLTWAPGDKYFPISYAERFAREVPNATLVPMPGARTFVSLDQPQRLSEEIAGFIG